MQSLISSLQQNQTTLLIDADLYVYRTLAASEEEICWDEQRDLWSLNSDLKQAKENFKLQLEAFCETFKTASFILCFTGLNNFRKTFHPEYKIARQKTRKPIGYSSFVNWCQDHYSFAQVDTLEADDVMGILATCSKGKTIIISDDKDMKTIPCTLYRPSTGETLKINRQEADRNFYKQSLIGDPTDGYKGCPKVGEVTATKLLAGRPDWSVVEHQYSKQGLSKQDALTQARCARILRYSDYDFKKKQVILWEPNHARNN